MHSLSVSWGGRFFCSPSLFVKAGGLGLPPVYFLYTEGSLIYSLILLIKRRKKKSLDIASLSLEAHCYSLLF